LEWISVQAQLELYWITLAVEKNVKNNVCWKYLCAWTHKHLFRIWKRWLGEGIVILGCSYDMFIYQLKLRYDTGNIFNLWWAHEFKNMFDCIQSEFKIILRIFPGFVYKDRMTNNGAAHYTHNTYLHGIERFWEADMIWTKLSSIFTGRISARRS